jgi:hypothetical protein
VQSYPLPRIVEFEALGDPSIGYISVAQAQAHIPFAIKRAFWTYGTPEHVSRGRHAHRQTELVLIAVAGTIRVFTELPGGETDQFELDRPGIGLYIPPTCWRTMTYTQDAVQLALASTDYDAEDYIRDRDDYLQHWTGEASSP